MSASARCRSSSASGRATPPWRLASSCACASVRLATSSRRTLPATRWRAASSMVSPAPISSTSDSSSRANDSCASRTAVDATDDRVARRCGCRCGRAWRWRRPAGTARSSGPPSAAGVARVAPGLLHLAEDLRLAQHQRVQPGGDAEQVAHGVGVVVPVQVGMQVVAGVAAGRPASRPARRGRRRRRRRTARCGCRSTAAPPRCTPAARAATPARAGSASVGERHPFAQADRRGLVVDAEDVQAHGAWW